MIKRCEWSLAPIHTVRLWKQSVAPLYELEHVTWCDLTLFADSSNIIIRAPTSRGASRLTSLVVTHFYKNRTCHKIQRLSNCKFSDIQSVSSVATKQSTPNSPVTDGRRLQYTHLHKTYHKLLENSDAGLQKHRMFHNIDIELKRPLTWGLCFQTVLHDTQKHR